MLQHDSVYINHHQGAHSLCFAKVTILISVIHVVNDDGLCKPNHVGTSVVIVMDFSNLAVCKIIFMRLSWRNKGFGELYVTRTEAALT